MAPLSLAHRRRLSAPTPFPQQLAEMEAELSGDLPCSPGLNIEPRTVAEVRAGVPMRRKPDLRVVESAAREEEPLLLTRPIASPDWIKLAGIALVPIAGWLVLWSAAYLIGQAFGWLSAWAWP